MDAHQSGLLAFLFQLAQFRIPIYQRRYSWTTTQCERLFKDIMKVGVKDSQNHFFGSIVAINPPGKTYAAVNKLEIIDGQQRLTTVTLLLYALSKTVPGRTLQRTNEAAILDYLFNKNRQKQEDKQKLILTYNDKETLDTLLNTGTLPKNPTKNIQVNYDYFTKKLVKLTDKEIDIFWIGIEKLQVATIGLDITLGDDPQLIFETLNSTGLKLTMTDLIRNFLLMGITEKDEQKRLYETHWQPMDKIIEGITRDKPFDNYMKDFLTVKRINIPDFSEIYEEFKDWKVDENKKNETCLIELHKLIGPYEVITNASHPDSSIKQALSNINKLKITASYPLLLQIFLDFEEDKITKDTVLEILDAIESYRFRRQVCELGTSGERELYAGLYQRIDKENDQVYTESVKAILQSQKGIRRFPPDDEFLDKLHHYDAYPKKNADYPLIKLENHLRLAKEPLSGDAEGISVEHILPQNPRLPDCWRKALGENWQDIQKENVNRLGNLTITQSNSEMSDNCFVDKKRIALDQTLYLLSDYFKDLTTWDEKNIETRTEDLAQNALKVWNHPNLPDEIVNKYRDDEDEEVEDEDADLNAEAEWEAKRKTSEPNVIQTLDKLTEKIEAKFPEYVSELHISHGDVRLYFFTAEPKTKENLFLIIAVKQTVVKIIYRIDPNDLNFVNKKIEYKNNESAAKPRKYANWFRKTDYIPEHAERIMRVYEEDLPLVLEQIEYAYQTTSKRLNYKNI